MPSVSMVKTSCDHQASASATPSANSTKGAVLRYSAERNSSDMGVCDNSLDLRV